VVGVFTGLVQEQGTVTAVDATDAGVRLTVATGLKVSDGDSIAVNGVCLTATGVAGSGFTADVMQETLRRSSLAGLAPDGRVNLELPLRADDRLGGHFVQGHVDGLGTVWDEREEGFSRVVTIGAPAEILRYVVQKGSIAVDGVSLTVSGIGDDWFQVSLIPETLERTILGSARVGQAVNLEVYVLAKYVERLTAVAR
jgi:riboflavin synthase